MPKLVETLDLSKKPFTITIYETPYRYTGFVVKCVECNATAGGSRVDVAEYDKAMSEIVHQFDCLTGRIGLEKWRQLLGPATGGKLAIGRVALIGRLASIWPPPRKP